MDKYPLELLGCIIDRKDHKKVEEIIQSFGIVAYSVLMGKGTANSHIGDLFGFGIIDRDFVSCVVETNKSKEIIEKLEKELDLTTPHNGVAFTSPINAISSDLLALLDINLGGKK